MIPRTIHQIWLGPNKPPEILARFRRRCRKMLPGWSIKLWREADIARLDLGPMVLKARPFAMAADIARLEILYRYGGFYLDVDAELVKGINYLRPSAAVFTHQNNGKWVTNHFMGAVPGFRVFREALPVVEANVKRLSPGRPFDIMETTGPHFLTRIKAKVAPSYPVRFIARRVHLDGGAAFILYDRKNLDVVGLHYAEASWSGQPFTNSESKSHENPTP